MLNIFDRQKAVEALKKMGPVAENPAMQMLTNRDIGVRIAACQILEDVGTMKAIPALNNLAKADRILSDAANRAVKKIMARG